MADGYDNAPLSQTGQGAPRKNPGGFGSGAGQGGRIPRILAVANQKGGVGKTTTAVNLATALAAIGKKVMLVDLDSQGNASTGLGIRRAGIRKSTYDVIFDDASVAETVQPTKVPGLYVLPSSIHLSGAEIELVSAEHREYRLQRALRVPMQYEYVIIDCPPSLSLLTLNALVASDAIVVPLQCEFFALEGLSHLVKTIDRVKKSFNPRLDIHGIVLTMFDRRNNLSDQVAADVRGHFGDKVYKTVIPRNVRLSEAPSYGLPAIVYDMRCPGARAYIALAGEILKRERQILGAGGAQNAGGGTGGARGGASSAGGAGVASGGASSAGGVGDAGGNVGGAAASGSDGNGDSTGAGAGGTGSTAIGSGDKPGGVRAA